MNKNTRSSLILLSFLNSSVFSYHLMLTRDSFIQSDFGL